MANCHRAIIYKTRAEFLASLSEDSQSQRWGKRIWRNHIDKNGNVPMIVKCPVCSERERKGDIKAGRFKPNRPTKVERDEIKGKAD